MNFTCNKQNVFLLYMLFVMSEPQELPRDDWPLGGMLGVLPYKIDWAEEIAQWAEKSREQNVNESNGVKIQLNDDVFKEYEEKREEKRDE